MAVYPVLWNDRVLAEANKFWFYALVLSVISGMYDLLLSMSSPSQKAPTPNKKAQKVDVKEPEKASELSNGLSSSTRAIMTRAIIDVCDLSIPGAFLGWIPVGGSMVGMAMVVSTTLASQDIWAKAQKQ